MKARTVFIRYAVCLLAAVLLSALPASSSLAERTSRVTICFDGDTLKLADGLIVRLAGIDTPETKKENAPAQYYADESRNLAESLAAGKEVRVVPEGGKKDFEKSYNRIVAEVYLPDGRSLNEVMVEEGAAFVYPHPSHSKGFLDKLLNLQRKAIDKRAGFWKRMLSEKFAEDKYVGNKNSLRFFPGDCPEKNRISPRNRVNFSSLKAAFTAGYAPARVCQFWPLAR